MQQLANKVYQTISQIMNQEQGKGLSNNKGSARASQEKKTMLTRQKASFFPIRNDRQKISFFLFCWRRASIDGELLEETLQTFPFVPTNVICLDRSKQYPTMLSSKSAKTNPLEWLFIQRVLLHSRGTCGGAGTILYQLKITTDQPTEGFKLQGSTRSNCVHIWFRSSNELLSHSVEVEKGGGREFASAQHKRELCFVFSHFMKNDEEDVKPKLAFITTLKAKGPLHYSERIPSHIQFRLHCSKPFWPERFMAGGILIYVEPAKGLFSPL